MMVCCKRVGLFFVLALYVFAGAAAPSHAGWLDAFLPEENKGPSPAETLKAPFADDDAVIVDMDSFGNAANRTPLHLRHRTNNVITRWVQQNIPNLLSYKTGTYKQEYSKNSKDFNEVGLSEYLTFLQEKNFLKTLETGRYDIAGFISEYPVIVNEGARDGYYRWLYQINIMVTYLEGGATDYRTLGVNDAITQEFIVTFQLGRSKDADNEHGLLIETWNVRAKPTK